MPTNGTPSGGAESREPANNIVPFGLRRQRRLTQQLEFEQQRLRDLGTEATRAIDRQIAKADLQDLPNWISGQLNSMGDGRIARGRISRVRSRLVARQKREFEQATGRTIRVPRGTTQRDYEDIIRRVRSGDPQAIEQFTRKR